MATWNGGDGDDFYNWTSSEPITMYGRGGNDTLFGHSGNDYISGDSGNDSLLGWYGDDTLYGESGNDSLIGGDGSDYLDGFSSGITGEIDTLTGGSGSDTFVLGTSWAGVYYQGNSWAYITDFSGIDDWIQVLGSASEYSLGYRYEPNTGSGLDTLIMRGNDVLAVVQDTTDVNIARDFKFV